MFLVILIVFIICLGSLQFGYHIAELNAPADIISCIAAHNENGLIYDCIEMSYTQIGFVTSIFNIGGLFSAICTSIISNKIGRLRTCLVATIFFSIGPLIMYFSHSFISISFGRFICGIGAGISIVNGPLYISEISPPQYRGALGTMNQVFINIGILAAELMGLKFSKPNSWRYIIIFGTYISLLSIIGLLTIAVESPVWLKSIRSPPLPRAALAASKKLFGVNYIPLLNDSNNNISNSSSPTTPNLINSDTNNLNKDIERQTPKSLLTSDSLNSIEIIKPLTVWQFIKSKTNRRVLIAVSGAMAAQQLCGINAIMGFGVHVLAVIIPRKYSELVNCFITFANIIVTLIASLLVDKLGRKPLLLVSIAGMAISSALISYSIQSFHPYVSSFSALIFVASYAIGLGPIPFLLASELADPNAANPAQSVGMTLSWALTFLVMFSFPPLFQAIEGFSFAIFSIFAILSFYFVIRFIPETKGTESAAEAWGDIVTEHRD